MIQQLKEKKKFTICQNILMLLVIGFICFYADADADADAKASAFEPIDLTQTTIYVRQGFDKKWLNLQPSDKDWFLVPGSSSGNRPVQIRNFNFQGIPKHTPFSLKSFTPEEFTLTVFFSLETMQIIQPGSLGLFIGSIGVNWEIYLNGHKVHQEVYQNKAEEILRARSLTNQVIELDKQFCRPGDNILNFRIIGDPADPETGFYVGHPFFIDRYKDALKKTREPLTLILISLYLLIGLFFIYLFLDNRQELSYLFFGLFCIDYFAYKLVKSNIFLELVTDTITRNRLEYIFLFLLIPNILGFIDAFLTRRVTRFVQVYSIFALILILFCLWTSCAFMHDLLRLFQFSIPIAFLHVFICFYETWYKKTKKTSSFKALVFSIKGTLLTGITICFVFGMIDVFRSFYYLTKYQISQYVFFLMTFPMGLALIQQFNNNRKELLNSQRVIAESRQLAIDNLEKADKLKDEFLANTSHELRTPIHGIMGITQAAMEQSRAANNSALQNSLHTVLSSARRLSILIDDILDYSRLKSSDIKLILQPVDIFTVSEVVIALSRPLADKKNLCIINEIKKDSDYVLADENRIYQILQNLVNNAIKFTEEGSVVLSAVPKEDHLVISVKDTGMGIEADKLETIFISFRQVDSSASRQYQGMGLGLSITKHLVKSHKGKIWVESQPGSGSTFFFSLPLTHEKPEADKEQAVVSRLRNDHQIKAIEGKERKRNGEHTILVVDDDPVNLQIVEDYLCDEYKVVTASNGKEALHHLTDNGKADLVLLDIMMPGISGLEVCERIRRTYSFDKLPIIFLSAKNQVSDLTQGFSLGANDYLSKPFSKGELLTRIRYHIDFNKQVEISSRRLSALKNFSGDLKNFKSKEQLSKAIYELLSKQVKADKIILFQENTPLLCNKNIDKIPAPLIQCNDKNIPHEEVVVEPFSLSAAEESGVVMKFRMEYLNEYIFLMYRSSSMGIFNQADTEFISSVIREVGSVKKNIQNFIQDETVLKKYLQIQSRIDDIYFIQADRQYCKILFEGERELRDFDWSLGDIETYFEEKLLLRVHRSFMVNPNKSITAVKEKGSRDYTIMFRVPHIADIISNMPDFKGVKLSRAKEQKCKKEFGHWFG